MSCLHPITIIKRNGERKQVACGNCLLCKIQKQKELQTLAELEVYQCYKKNQGSSFCTLTYSDENLPENGSLKIKHIQDLLKRVRIQIKRNKNYLTKKFKVLYCGEYGDEKFSYRPHYHIIFIGLFDCEVKEILKEKWQYGLIQVKPLRQGGIRYVIKYMTKSVNGHLERELYNSKGLEQPFIKHSIKLGEEFIENNIDNITATCNNIISGHYINLSNYQMDKIHKAYGTEKVRKDFIYKKYENRLTKDMTLEKFIQKDNYYKYLQEYNKLIKSNLPIVNELNDIQLNPLQDTKKMVDYIYEELLYDK